MALSEELYDVFYVTQLTRGTALQDIVGVDWVRMEPWQCSQKHRHNMAETVLVIKEGSGYVVVNDATYLVKTGDRVCIPMGAWHFVTSFQDGLQFISIQSPSIHDDATGRHDLEAFSEQENKK